jgi:hypothetical protein
MAFSPIALPIQEILLSNFVTDISTISNSNDLILQSTLEDLINNLEIDTAGLTIGSNNAITSVKTKTLILQDTGFIYQTGSPNSIIAKLEKDTNSKSILTVDTLISNDIINASGINVSDLSILNSTAVTSTVTGKSQYNGPLVESKSSVTVDFTKSTTTAIGTLTLDSSSPKNIFVKVRVTSAPGLNPIYSGTSLNSITLFNLTIEFDAANPPAENSAFTIYIVDIVENQLSTSIMPAVISALCPIVIRTGQNNNTSSPIYLHSGAAGLGATTYDVGINPNSVNTASNILKSNIPIIYGSNLSLLYIKDESNKDRMLITGMTAMEFFNP